jgi:hypothetical protein
MKDLIPAGATWRKSSYSSGADSECVEVASAWRKSTHSGSTDNSCVEVAEAERLVAVRDSKHPDGSILLFDQPQWRALLSAISPD